jgi:transposase
MHLRTSTTKRKGRTYRYVQLVQSYRRQDGVPANKVIATLGVLPEQTIENLKLALKASREGKALVVTPDEPGLSDSSKVRANLRYLDVAVMLVMWRSWGLDELLREIMPSVDTAAEAGVVISALVLQRSVAPGSKLYAQRWLPTTALPELLGLTVERFNNTRLHRVLSELHAVTPVLQQRLAELYRLHHGPFSSLYVDLTDTYFEGRGCDLAEIHRTKAGLKNKWSIGIVLMINQDGYPLRWQVVSSKSQDHQEMETMVEQVKVIEWAGKTPIVFDRAMGRKTTISKLLASRLHFLTAAPVNMIDTYTDGLPHGLLSQIEVQGTDASREDDIRLAAEAARGAGLKEIDKDLFVLDLGVVDCDLSNECKPGQTGSRRERTNFEHRDIASWLRLARQLQLRQEAGQFFRKKDFARELGITRTQLSWILDIQHLAPDIQERFLECEKKVYLPWKRMSPVLRERSHAKQRKMLEDVLNSLSIGHGESLASAGSGVEDESKPLQEADDSIKCGVRLVACFNPEVFLQKRRHAQATLNEIKSFVDDLNRELAAPGRSRQEEPTLRRIMRKLEQYDYIDVFDVVLNPIRVTSRSGSPMISFQCEVKLKSDKWMSRRRYDGFLLLVGHPDLALSGEQMVRLYRSKDIVEKGFQSIKSVLKLRPIYSYTDLKVEAHVTICMLALLIQRTLENRLRRAKLSMSAAAALEILSACHLNLMKKQVAGRGIYSVTEATLAQREILHALELSNLINDRAVTQIITPRVESVST